MIDRVLVNSILIVLCFVSIFGLGSQSAASWPTYLLAVSMLLSLRRWDDVAKVPYFWTIAALLAYLSISSFWSSESEWPEFFSVLTRALLILLFVVAYAECQLRGQLRVWLGRSLALTSALAALVTLYVYFGSQDYELGRAMKGLGQLDNSIIAGIVFGAALIIVLDVLVHEKSNAWKAASFVCVGILAAAVWNANSQNAFGSLTLGLVCYFLVVSISDRFRAITALVSFIVLLATVLIALSLGDVGTELLFPRGDSYRLEIWRKAIDQTISANIWFGNGISTSDRIFLSDLSFSHPHSIYVALFFQGGLVALGLFFGLLVHSFRLLFAEYDDRDSKLGMSLLIMAVSTYLLDGHELVDKVSDVWLLIWLPVAICLGSAWRKPPVTIDEEGG